LDADGQGEITEEEFTEAVFHLSLSNVDFEILQDRRLLRGLKQKSEHIIRALARIDDIVGHSFPSRHSLSRRTNAVKEILC